MAQVVNNSEVTHLWAHKQQLFARNANSSLFFAGDTIFSYGNHFPIARHVQNDRGEHAVLFTTEGHSMTTAHHKGLVRRAIPHYLLVFNVNLIARYYTPGVHVQHYGARIKELGEEVLRSRSNKAGKYSSLLDLVQEANRYCEFFNREERFVAPEDLENLKADLNRWAYEANERERLEQERAEAQVADHIDVWRNGGLNNIPQRVTRCFLRISRPFSGQINLQTSQGAVFPLEHAARGLRFVKALRALKRPYKRSQSEAVELAPRLGAYTIDAVDVEGNVTAGCHYVEWSEIERIAPEIERLTNEVASSVL